MKVKEVIDRGERESVLIFSDFSSELIEVDFRGTINDVLKRLEKPTVRVEAAAASQDTSRNVRRGPGRPKLGVVSREVTLLPRHWDWLNSQPGGASVALRKLVEEARRVNSGRDKVRHSQEAAYKFMSAMAGNLPGFEEATRLCLQVIENVSTVSWLHGPPMSEIMHESCRTLHSRVERA